jgi:AraC-like DNA-binding protein
VRSRSDGRSPLKELAALVALSPSRLEHLFKTTTGVSLRHYLLWQRLRRAVEELATGSSVTRAAHSAGFSDTAHLSRTFRRMLGFTPSSALQRQGSSFVQAHDETPG